MFMYMEREPSERFNSSKPPEFSRGVFRVFGETTTRLARESESRGGLSPSAREEIRSAFGGSFPLEEFMAIHDPRVILSDARHINKKDYVEKFRAKNLENVTRFGIERGRWLDIDGEKPTIVFPTSKYDDIHHRIDFGIAMFPPEEETEGRSEKLAFGIDVTYNASAIEEKLARPSNDPNLRAPFSHSRLKYYDDGEETGDKIVPRFVVAMDYFDDDKLIRQKPDSPGMLRIRFKVLSELVPQAQAISEHLTDQDPDEERQETRDALSIHESLEGALRDSVSAILSSDDVAFRFLRSEVDRSERMFRARTGRPLPFSEKLKILVEDTAAGDDVYKAMMKKLGN